MDLIKKNKSNGNYSKAFELSLRVSPINTLLGVSEYIKYPVGSMEGSNIITHDISENSTLRLVKVEASRVPREVIKISLMSIIDDTSELATIYKHTLLDLL